MVIGIRDRKDIEDLPPGTAQGQRWTRKTPVLEKGVTSIDATESWSDADIFIRTMQRVLKRELDIGMHGSLELENECYEQRSSKERSIHLRGIMAMYDVLRHPVTYQIALTALQQQCLTSGADMYGIYLLYVTLSLLLHWQMTDKHVGEKNKAERAQRYHPIDLDQLGRKAIIRFPLLQKEPM